MFIDREKFFRTRILTSDSILYKLISYLSVFIYSLQIVFVGLFYTFIDY